jgi:hypothetical protein
MAYPEANPDLARHLAGKRILLDDGGIGNAARAEEIFRH